MSRPTFALLVASLAALLAVQWVTLRTAGAQRDVRRTLALEIAKVAVNEASLSAAPADVALVHQVATARAEGAEAQLRWIRQHSSCVTTTRRMTDAERRGNCRWTRHLADDDSEPADWPEGARWDRFVDRWRSIRRYAWRLVSGRVTHRPCGGDPFTWGGTMDDPPPGLVALPSRGTRNTCYALRAGGAS